MDQKPAILYVEDDSASILVMRMIMEKVMRIPTMIVFRNSDRFMERVRLLGFIPDLFLLDIQIKPHNGFDLLRMLHSDSKYKTCKIVALTASVMNEEVDKLKQSGFDGAIAKPLNISAFPGLIERIVRGESVWYVT